MKDREVHTTRVVTAARERVFAAWTGAVQIWNSVNALGNDHASMLKACASSGESEMSSPTLYQMGTPMAMHMR